jgi:antitoxin component YwqK of YwqJK toxin-antitoxin module
LRLGGTGVVRHYNDDKSILHVEYFVVNGRKEGPYKSYYNNGNICVWCNYVDDMRNGPYILYYDTGQICKFFYYKDNKEMVPVNGIFKTDN